MIEILNICEPTKLFLTWQPKEGRTRFVVGDLSIGEDDSFELNLYTDTDEYCLAEECGFKGLPFISSKSNHASGSMIEIFYRRLPPQKRGDFEHYLKSFLLPHPYTGSAFSLLGHTGAKLPGDGLTLIPDFFSAKKPFDYLLEVAGTRHQQGVDIDKIQIGDRVAFVKEPDNAYDNNAIAIYHEKTRIGYVNRVSCSFFNSINLASIDALVAKKSGTKERPLIFVKVSVK